MRPKTAPKSAKSRAGIVTAATVAVLTVAAIGAANWGAQRVYRQSVQQAADSAALAGASYLPANPALAEQTAVRYATANLENCPAIAGGASCPGAAYLNQGAISRNLVKTTLSPDHQMLTVKVAEQVRVLVLPFLGNVLADGVQGYRTVTATSTAQASSRATDRDLSDSSAVSEVVYQGRALRPVVSVQRQDHDRNHLDVLVQ